MKGTLFACVTCFVAGVAVALAQLWLGVFTPEVFVKLEITLGSFFVVLVVVWFMRKEYRDYRRQQNHTGLDE